MQIQATDYHTAGEPFRIVSGGIPSLDGGRVLERRTSALRDLDHVRQFLVNEPRGHADMYGCFVTPPDDSDGDLGAVFFHNAGYSTACGHGTIALVTWAIESGFVDAPNGHVIVDVPSGRLETFAELDDRRVRSVRFRNVPAYVFARGLELTGDFAGISADISYGGAFYASIAVRDLGQTVSVRSLPELISAARSVKRQLEERLTIQDTVEPLISGLYGVTFHEHVASSEGWLTQRNVTVFADGEVDRSPCGSGTSARLALLDDSGDLPEGASFRNIGITEQAFTSAIVERTSHGPHTAVITEVEGSAFLTGFHTFVLQPDDPLGTGFLLR